MARTPAGLAKRRAHARVKQAAYQRTPQGKVVSAAANKRYHQPHEGERP